MTSTPQTAPPRTGLLLGVERSGSTWLSNLFDSAPDVETYMEPFARVAGIIDGFPDRLDCFDKEDVEEWESLSARLDALSDLKYHGLEWPGAPGWLRAANWMGHEWLNRANTFLPGRVGSKIQAYSELNFNRRDNPAVQHFNTARHPGFRLFKLLRLNTKARLIEKMFPEATVTVIIRNPLAQCLSIVRRMDQGSLLELHDVFETLSDSLDRHPRLERFSRALDTAPEDSRFSRAVAYWFVNYSILLQDLEPCDLDVQTVRYETLCEEPEETTAEVFSHHGLTLGTQTRTYIAASTSGSFDAESATDTSRNSSTYYRRQLEQLSRETVDRFWEVSAPFWNLAPEPVQHYETWLDRFIGPTH